MVDALFHRVLFCCYVHSAGFQAHLVWPQLSQSVQSVPESSEYVQPHVSIPVAAFDGGTSDTPVLFSLIVFFFLFFFEGEDTDGVSVHPSVSSIYKKVWMSH